MVSDFYLGVLGPGNLLRDSRLKEVLVSICLDKIDTLPRMLGRRNKMVY